MKILIVKTERYYKNCKSNQLFWLGLFLFSILLLAILGNNFLVIIEDKVYSILADDSMISLRYSKNLANGNGLAWNPNERVEGYSNFLWTVIGAIIHLFPISDSNIPLVIVILNIGFTLLTIKYFRESLNSLAINKIIINISSFISLLTPSIIIHILKGFSNIFIMLLLTYLIKVILTDENNIQSWKNMLIIFSISIIRIDAFIYTFMFIISIIYRMYAYELNKQDILFKILIFSFIPLGNELFRVLYYGDFMPNPYYHKINIDFSTKILDGGTYVGYFILSIFPIILSYIVSFIKIYKKKPPRHISKMENFLIMIVLFTTGFIFFEGGDAFPFHRFFTPIYPLIYILGAINFKRIIDNNTFILNQRNFGQILFVLLSFLFIFSANVQNPLMLATMTFHPESGLVQANLLYQGVQMRNTLSANTTIGVFWAGTTPYYSNLYSADFLGLNDKYIAHLEQLNSKIQGHGKYNISYTINKYDIDIIQAPFSEPPKIRSRDYPFSYDLYHNKDVNDKYILITGNNKAKSLYVKPTLYEDFKREINIMCEGDNVKMLSTYILEKMIGKNVYNEYVKNIKRILINFFFVMCALISVLLCTVWLQTRKLHRIALRDSQAHRNIASKGNKLKAKPYVIKNPLK